MVHLNFIIHNKYLIYLEENVAIVVSCMLRMSQDVAYSMRWLIEDILARKIKEAHATKWDTLGHTRNNHLIIFPSLANKFRHDSK